MKFELFVKLLIVVLREHPELAEKEISFLTVGAIEGALNLMLPTTGAGKIFKDVQEKIDALPTTILSGEEQ